MPQQPHARQLEEMFTRAAELFGLERANWLRDQRATHPELIAEVEALLAADERNRSGFLDRPFVNFAVGTADILEDGERESANAGIVSVGAYRIIGRIGQGGMGEVHKGAHAATGREAGIKLLRSEMGAKRSIERLKLEAQTLGRLNEPRIAQLFDAGMAEAVFADGTRSNRAFIAMEYVDGLAITAHAHAHRLDTAAKIALMESVARAMQHAHQRGVIHRDLKPGNILVGPGSGEKWTPKIVDFGIAKLIDESGGCDLTMTGQILGTVRYMSPEQAGGDPAGVDTRSDVYSLGAVLYELLADRPVIESQSGSALVLVGQVLNQRPPRLATLRPEFHGDIDAVVHKAIERDAKDRYQSAGDLADDLARLVRGEPVSARAPTAIERVVRGANRNKALSAAIAAAALALIGGTAISIWQARVASDQAVLARRASEEAQDKARLAREQAAEAIRQRDMLQGGREAWMHAISQFTDVIVRAAATKPDVRAAILKSMRDSLTRAEKPSGTLASLRAVTFGTSAEIFEQLGEMRDALAWRTKSLQALEEAGRPDDPQLLTERGMVAILRLRADPSADPAECEKILRDCRTKLASDVLESETVSMRFAQAHANALERLGRFDESEKIYLRLIEVLGNTPGEPMLLDHVRGLLGVMYRKSRRPAEAVPLLRGRIDQLLRARVAESQLLPWYDNLANAYEQLGKDSDAAEAYGHIQAIQSQTLGDNDPQTAMSRRKVGLLLARLGRTPEAVEQYAAALDALRKQQPTNDREVLAILNDLARLHLKDGRLEKAEPLIIDADKLVENLPPADRARVAAQVNRALLLHARGDSDGARNILKQIQESLVKIGPIPDATTRELRPLLNALGEASGSPQGQP